MTSVEHSRFHARPRKARRLMAGLIGLLPVPAAHAELSEARVDDVADYVSDRFRTFCLENPVDRLPVIARSSESLERAPTGTDEDWTAYRDTHPDAPDDLRITIRLKEDRCAVVVPPEGSNVLTPVVKGFMAAGNHFPAAQFRTSDGGLMFLLRPLSDDGHRPNESHGFRLMKDGEVRLVRFVNVDRIIMADSDARFRFGVNHRSRGGTKRRIDVLEPRADMLSMGNRLSLIRHSEFLELYFKPRFYPYLDDGRSHLTAVDSIKVDGEELPAARNCDTGDGDCRTTGGILALKLEPGSDDQSLRMLADGHQLSINARSDMREKFAIWFLLGSMDDVSDRFDGKGWDAWVDPVRRGDRDAVEKMLDDGMSPNMLLGKNLEPVVVVAARHGHMELARYLIRQGARVDAYYAGRRQRLKESPEPVGYATALAHAARYDRDATVMRRLLELRADPAHGDLEGRPVLFHVRLRSGGDDKLEALRASGADMGITDRRGRNALHVFAAEGRIREMDWLVDHGVDIDHADDEHLTPLHLALKEGEPDSARWLVRAGAGLGKNPGGGASIDARLSEGALYWAKRARCRTPDTFYLPPPGKSVAEQNRHRKKILERRRVYQRKMKEVVGMIASRLGEDLDLPPCDNSELETPIEASDQPDGSALQRFLETGSELPEP